MKDIVLAQKYVRALREQTQKGNLEPIVRTLKAMCQYISHEERVLTFLTSPLSSVEQKSALIDKINTKLNGSPETKQFMNLLISKKRITLVNVLPQLLNELQNEITGQIEVNVYTPFEFSNDSKNQFLGVLQKVIKKEIKTNFIQDPSIIGGFRAQIDNTVFDGTINNALGKLNEAITR